MIAVAYNLVKFNTIAFFAALATFLLFYFMQYLIAADGELSPRLTVTKIVDGTVPEFLPILIEDIEPPTEIDVVVEEPVFEDSTPNSDGGYLVPNSEFVPTTEFDNDGIQIGLVSDVMIPLVRTTANYPARALSRGIEGFVELSFTVNALGEVEDPVVTYAEPEGVFERSALQSIKRWKYNPALNEGVAIATYDVRQRIVYQMNKTQ